MFDSYYYSVRGIDSSAVFAFAILLAVGNLQLLSFSKSALKVDG